MTFAVRPLPCNYTALVHCVCMGRTWPASDWQGSQAVANCLHACVKAKGGYFEHSLP